jgi:hypothetical protein
MTLRALSMGSAIHVIHRMLNPRCLSQMACYDVASTIHLSLAGGPPTTGEEWIAAFGRREAGPSL